MYYIQAKDSQTNLILNIFIQRDRREGGNVNSWALRASLAGVNHLREHHYSTPMLSL